MPQKHMEGFRLLFDHLIHTCIYIYIYSKKQHIIERFLLEKYILKNEFKFTLELNDNFVGSVFEIKLKHKFGLFFSSRSRLGISIMGFQASSLDSRKVQSSVDSTLGRNFFIQYLSIVYSFLDGMHLAYFSVSLQVTDCPEHMEAIFKPARVNGLGIIVYTPTSSKVSLMTPTFLQLAPPEDIRVIFRSPCYTFLHRCS